MALGRKFWTFGEADIIRGISTSDDLSDAGFSPNTDAVNLIASPGILYQTAAPVDKSTNVAGLIIASCDDGQILGANRVFVDSSGNFYSWNGAVMTLARTDGGHAYTQGKTDMASYEGSVFATSAETVIKWTVDSLFNASYFAFTTSQVPHPDVVYEGNIYYGDKNVLYRQVGASGTPTVVLTLTSEQTIVDLDIDTGTGDMLITTTTSFNISDTINHINKIHFYDGLSLKTRKTMIVDEMVSALFPNGGQIYAGYGQNLGYFDGGGLTRARRLNVAFDNTELPYKQHFTNIGSTVFVIEKTKILAHGPVKQNDNKVFYYLYKNNIDSTNLAHVCYLGQNILGFSFGTNKFYTLDVTSVATSNTQTLFSNENNLDDYNDGVWLRRVKIFWKNGVANNVDPGSITFFNEDGQITSIGQSGLFDLVNDSGATSASKTISIGGGTGCRVQQLQFRMTLDTVNPGIRRIVFYGDPANQP